MIKIENVEVYGVESAIKGMRNSFDSWDKSDSYYYDNRFVIGPQDMQLALKLARTPSEGKFLRQIFVSMDITGPLFWWKEMDQYKIGTTTNSTSTMHTLTKHPITIDMFTTDVAGENKWGLLYETVKQCELLRREYVETKDINVWRKLILLLPCSFNQKRTWTANYQVLRNIYQQRRYHKLSEWREFCDELPRFIYHDLITDDLPTFDVKPVGE